MIALTWTNNKKIFVNPDHVVWIEPTKDGCWVHMTNGSYIPVKNSVSNVIGLIELYKKNKVKK